MDQTHAEGWRTDPDTGRYRYWNGTVWEDDARAQSGPSPAAQPQPAAPAYAPPAQAPPAQAPPAPQRPLRNIPGSAVALIVVGGLVLWGGLGAASAAGTAAFLQGVNDGFADGIAERSGSGGEPPVLADAEPLAESVPAGWATQTSPSGRIVYAADPSWEAVDGDDPSVFTDLEPDAADIYETAGWWYLEGDAGYVQLTATLDYSYAWGAQEDAEWFMDPGGAYESTPTSSRAVTTDAGYAGYEIVADADSDGDTFEECVIVLDTGTSTAMVYATSEDPAVACTDLIRPMAQSIVID